MIKAGKIGLKEAVAISTLVLVAKVFYTNPAAVIKSVGTASWYATLISVIVSGLLFMLVYQLLKRFPGRTLGDVFEDVFGKILGKILVLPFVGYFIFYAASNLREFIEMIKAYNLPYTQPSIIMLTFLLPVAIIAYSGLEVLSRISYICFWIVIPGIFVILTLAYPIYVVDGLFPFGGYGMQKILSTGIIRHSAYNELIVLAFITYSLQGLRHLKKAGLASLAISGTAISLVILCSIMAFGYTMAREHLSNLFELSRAIFLGRFFQRLEPIFIFVWVIASVVVAAAVFFIALSAFCRAFAIDDHKPLILPFIFMTFTIALLPENLSTTIFVGTNFQRQSSSLIIYLIPIVTLIVSLIFNKKGAETKVEEE